MKFLISTLFLMSSVAASADPACKVIVAAQSMDMNQSETVSKMMEAVKAAGCVVAEKLEAVNHGCPADKIYSVILDKCIDSCSPWWTRGGNICTYDQSAWEISGPQV